MEKKVLIKKARDISAAEITPESFYIHRREIIKGMAGAGLAASIPFASLAAETEGEGLKYKARPDLAAEDERTPYDKATTYNNFYEFGTGKQDPSRKAHTLITDPWNITVEGEAENTGNFQIEDILKGQQLEERIYRMRCVEAWSMVIPWVGFELSALIKRFKPTSKAKYVRFTTLYDPKQMPGQRRRVVPWPYIEGLRMDEAMNSLTILAVGMYGKTLPKQNGAPLRLVVPWKYGFKGIKSIVKIEFVEHQPVTTWALSAPKEYGFYANVNPEVNHPRWSQASERRIGPGFSLFNPRIPTRMFNGYEEQVAHLYKGMDLKKYF